MKIKPLILIALFLSIATAMVAQKPRWMTSSLPKPKSEGYFFVTGEGSGTTPEEARQRAFINLTQKLEHERGIEVTSTVKAIEEMSRHSTQKLNQTYSIEVKEHGKLINITCRIVDQYQEYANGRYFATDLYTVNDPARPGKGSSDDDIRVTTSYGAAPVLYSLIPGVGQFAKGSTAKGIAFLGGTAVGVGAVIVCETQRANYAKKMKERPQHFDFYRNKKSSWETGRNVAIGVTGAVYLWNLIDAAIAPGRRQVVVDRRSYACQLAPVVFDNGVGVGFAMNF